ncbi:S1 family peptidase [Lysobacter enzymogenes]|uniref:S1 family peptidase n=1 Tax=Lysobacter enzymogenes TaxID=69 RepID=UPI001AF53C38|nr:trypsin-like serine protease [Lysobacter enzymogenes]QQP99518.1 trypsin-like serine protease [Lysobacter enzymogenes]
MTLRFLSAPIAFLFLVASCRADAITIRDDTGDAEYRVAATHLPALADLPGEGHGVLIAPQWVLTAAHAVSWQEHVDRVVIAGKPRRVERVVLHPGFKRLPQALIDRALAGGDGNEIVAFLSASDDVALVKLVEPVADAAPVALYRGQGELGKTVEILGKGATGTGARGHDLDGSHRTELRRARNRIDRADARWLCYTFDRPPAALPLEGMAGNGDSGGPVLLRALGRWRLAGLASWKIVQGDVRTTRPAQYGHSSCNVRVSRYVGWIDQTMNDRMEAKSAPGSANGS